MRLFKKKNIIKEEIEEKQEEFDEESYAILQKKCENCGASLKVNKDTLDCRCDFCRTEYYVKENKMTGEIDDVMQIVELKIRGEYKKFYIAEERFNKIWGNAERNINGQLVGNLIATKEILKLIEI